MTRPTPVSERLRERIWDVLFRHGVVARGSVTPDDADLVEALYDAFMHLKLSDQADH